MGKDFYELTTPQKIIWYTEEVFKGTPIENITGTVIIPQKVDFQLLEKAINIFVERNDSFRLKFFTKNNSIYQYVDEYAYFPLTIIDVTTEVHFKKYSKKIAQTPFNILNSFLFDFKLIRFPDNHGGFIINMHHLISDAWSAGLGASEIIKIYTSLLKNKLANTEYPSYIDYIKSEQEYMETPKFDKDKVFWNSLYNVVPEVATIPASITDSKTSIGQATREEFDISKDIIDKINEICKNSKFSIFNFFMAIFSIYIGRVSGLDEFVIGSPILNRSNVKEKRTSGMFISTLPVKVSLTDNMTFSELASNISKNLFNIFKHQKYPYSTLLTDLRQKHGNIPNLYNILMSYQNIRSTANTSETPYNIQWFHNDYISEDIDIHIHDINNSGIIKVSYDYQISKYTKHDIEQIHSRILNLIDQVLLNNTISINDLEIVTPLEKEELLHKYDNIDINYPADKTVCELFEEQVKKTPNNIAVVFKGTQLTYKELNERANSLAHHLRSHGIGRNDVVALRLDKSLEMIISILAIIKAGACYLPINLSYPQDRVDFMLKDSNTKFLLCDKQTAATLKTNTPQIFVDLDNSKIYSKNTHNLPIINKPLDNIYIIYTSGSTGSPKGAMIMHKNVVRLMKNDNFLFDFNDRDVWTMFHSVSFDFSVWEMYGALLYGGKLVVISDDIAKDPNLFLNLMEKECVTVLNQTPTYFYNLLSCEIRKPHTNLKIRYIIFGGEALKPSLIADWNKFHPQTKLINMYGITETTVHVTFKELSASNLQSPISDIGVPIPTLKILLLDKNLKLVPPGIPGEICVCGEGVFKGYLNRTDLNKIKLVPNPYNPNEIMYRSADSAFINSNGDLEYIGRIDTQVKIRGFRVELGEIEEKILQFSNISSCVVIPQNPNNMHDILYAYYISEAEIDIEKLKSHLNKTLPTYMIPQYFVRFEKWPYNSNGKIDKKALPLLEETFTKEIIKPRNDIDSKVIETLKKLLSFNEISIDNSFTDLGGDSLTAINLCALIQEEFNVQIFVRDILEHPKVYEISDIISERLNNIQKQNKLLPAKEMPYYPLSSAQKRMYISSNMSGKNSILYNIPAGIILDKMPDISKLEDSINKLISRHESLRTYFVIENNNIVQKIEKTAKINLELVKKTVSWKNLKKEFANFVRPFDLSKAPLLRTKLIKLDNNKVALLIDIHHIISDGESSAIFIDELCKLYNGQTLENIDFTYKDFAVWEHDNLSHGLLKEAENFWINQFNENIPELNFPTNFPRPTEPSVEGDKLHFSLDLETTNSINSLAKELNVTPYMLLLSAYYVLLKKYTSQEDIVIGSPIVGRNFAELYNIVGMFVNTLPLRISIDSKKSFKELLKTVKTICLNSFKYQTYPFDELVAKLNIERSVGKNPLFDIMFIYQNNGLREINFNGIKSKYYIPDTKTSKFDLSLEIIPNDNGLKLSFEYSTRLFRKDFIHAMSVHYINILNSILENANSKITDIDMLSHDEKNKILYNFNNTDINFKNTRTITEIFENQALKTPKKTAIVFENKKIDYKTLNEKANTLAHYLRKNGVTRNDVVGIMQNRSIEMIISILAVLKSGGTYLLIDNSLPNNRVQYMLADSNSKLLIVDSEYNVDFANIISINNFDYSANIDNLKCKNQLFDSFSIIYTSGSTGNPKGVLLQQKGLINLVYSFNKIMEIGSTKNHLGVSSISFDMFAVEIYTSLLLGRTLYLLSDEEIKNPMLMSQIIIDNNVEFLITTPTKIELLLTNIKTAQCLKCLKGIQLGGEVFSANLYEKLKKYTKAKIYNGYGPTEITACCSNKLVTSKNNINIGKPIPNTQIYILDKDMNICPIDVPGELCVAGKGVSLGYINDKVKTEENFVSVNFIESKLYRTGDIAKYNSVGELEYIGRNDFQVKLNGLRIELNEIEKKLSSIREIENSIVICDKSKTFLKAFFTASEKLSIPAIRKRLSESLPNYMIPKYIFQIDKMPITSNGKIDRRVLDEYKTSISEEAVSYVEPETELQELFCKIWENILSTKVGIDNDLFELGADSLSAIKFKVEALNNNIDVPYSDIFKYKTIRNLSESNSTEAITTPIENFNYDKIDVLLKKNKKQMNYKIEKTTNNNILLLGSNGFVGMHVIDSFIKKDSGTIYCIMRDKNGIGAHNRFLDVLHFYFGNTLDKYVGNRIIVLRGDIIKENFGLSNRNYETVINNVSTIINAAANVKHFGNFDKFKTINIDVIIQAIEFCRKYSKRLIHLSTLSVSGNMFLDGSISRDTLMNNKKVYFAENNLFINQSLDNVYTRSKFEAEKIILDNISDGLDAQILRLGNITSRASDGKFQVNPNNNAFLNRLKSFVLLGFIPKSLLKQEIEFTAVDECSNAIICAMQNKCTHISILHIYNRNHSNGEKMLKAFKNAGIAIQVVNDKDFSKIVKTALANASVKNSLSGIINDLDMNKTVSYKSNTYIKSDFSLDFLQHCKFKWHKIDKIYLERYINYLKSINFFENN